MAAENSTTSVTVDIVCATGPVPFLGRGRIRSQKLGSYVIDVDRDATDLPVGARVILSLPDGESDRVVARVDSAVGNELRCTQEQLRQRERREFPRLHAGMPVRYHRVPPAKYTAIATRWLRGHDDALPADSEGWVEPEPFMNYSVTGLRFQTQDDVVLNEVVLLELGVPGRDDRWRVSARCVHAGPTDPEEGQSIALEFVQISDDARAALTALTLESQSKLLN